MRLQMYSAAIAVVALALTTVIHVAPDNQPTATSTPRQPAAPPVAIVAETCDKAALPDTKKTLKNLARFCTNEAGVLSGQNIGELPHRLDVTYRHTWTKLEVLRALPTPAVMAADLGSDPPKKTSALIKYLSDHAEAGGLVSLSMHPSNPWTGGDYDDCRGDYFELLTTPGRLANDRWSAYLKNVGDVLEELQRRQITVLWRPLHEANGDWFWWCVGGEQPALKPHQYQKLWREMYHYFHRERKLHNLLWVYSANVRTGPEVASFKPHYPGNDFVDIAALDFYGDIRNLDRTSCFQDIQSFGKVVALSEFGAKPMNGSMDAELWVKRMQTDFPQFAYFVYWHSWARSAVALADLDQSSKILRNDFVKNRVDYVDE